MTNRRDFLATLTMAAGAVTLLKPLNSFANFGQPMSAPGQSHRLIILHTANLRGQRRRLSKQDPFVELGGLQNISSNVADIRKEAIPVLLVDAGNMRSTAHYKNEESLEFYKELGRMQYDVVLPGETDLTNGNEYFKEMAAQSRLQALAHPGKGISSQIVLKGGIRIGVIALKASSHKASSPAFISLLNKTATELKTVSNCALVIVLAQGNRAHCAQLALRSSAVDVIATSDINNSLYNTTILHNASGHEVILSTAGSRGVMMSRIDIGINSSGEKIAVDAKAIIGGGSDLAASEVLRKYKALQC